MTVCNPPAKPLPYRNPISRTQILSYYLVSEDGSAELLSLLCMSDTRNNPGLFSSIRIPSLLDSSNTE